MQDSFFQALYRQAMMLYKLFFGEIILAKFQRNKVLHNKDLRNINFDRDSYTLGSISHHNILVLKAA